MPPIVPLVLWTSTLLAAFSLLAVTSNSTTQASSLLGVSSNNKTKGASGKHGAYNACSIIEGGNYYADSVALNTSAEGYLYEYCATHYRNLDTRVSGRALKENKCCRVCCNITVNIPPYAKHFLFDLKAPYGFPCGENKICDEKQMCILKPNGTIKINETIERDWNNFGNHIEWVSGPWNDYEHK
uniref:Putative ixostatin n=1 Tax=Ixodes ricinus TaxID=34613 RepID=A0A0K8RGM8_IXORI